jgi:hypothetical protein
VRPIVEPASTTPGSEGNAKMKNRNYRKALSVPDLLSLIVQAAKAGDVEAAKSMSDMVAVQTTKAKSFGRTAVRDAAYDPLSPSVRGPLADMKNVEVGASCLPHCNDDDYGPPTTDEHKLTTWLAVEMTDGLAKGLPPVVIARRCAARVLDKNAKRYSTFHREAVTGINELLLRLDPNTTNLLAMNGAYEPVQMPSDAPSEMHTRAEPPTDREPANEADAASPTDTESVPERQERSNATNRAPRTEIEPEKDAVENGMDNEMLDAAARAHGGLTHEELTQ